MKKGKKISVLLLCFIMVLSVFSGCAGSQPADEPQQVEITYWQQARADGSLVDFENIAKRFMDENPNIKVTIEEKPVSEIGAITDTSVMAGEQPDIIRDTMMRMGKYAQKGLLAPLDDMYPDFKEKFVGGCVDLATVNGNIYGVPSTYGAYAVLINVDLFKQAGAENLLPKDPDRTWTREEFEAALKAVSKNGVYGTGLYAASEQSDLDTKTMIEGGNDFFLFSDDGLSVRYDEQRGIDGVAWLKKLVDNKLAFPGPETMIDDDCWALFAEQKIAVLPANTFCLGWIKEGVAKGEFKAFETMTAQYPNVDGSTSKAPVNAIVFSVFDKGDPAKIEASKKFVQFLVEQEEETKTVKAQGEFSAQLAQANLFADDPQLNWVAQELSKYAYNPGVAVKGFADVRFALFPELQAVYTDTKTPEQAMKDFAEKANQILAEANK